VRLGLSAAVASKYLRHHNKRGNAPGSVNFPTVHALSGPVPARLGPMDDLRRASADLAKSGIEFVITELDMALTFLDIADTSKIDETVKRNQENARKAYETVQRLLKDLRPNRDEKALIGAKISVLEARLQAGGYQL
jgi:hypothetical protein